MGHHGFIGLAIFLALCAFTWLSASSIIRAAKRHRAPMWLRDLMASVQVSLIAYLTAGAFLGLAYFDYLYNLVLIVVLARVLVAQNAAGLSQNTGEQIGAREVSPAPAAVTRAVADARSSVQ